MLFETCYINAESGESQYHCTTITSFTTNLVLFETQDEDYGKQIAAIPANKADFEYCAALPFCPADYIEPTLQLP